MAEDSPQARREFDEHRRHADRTRRGRPAFRGPHRHPVADAAQPLRRRIVDVALRHLRRAGGAADRRPRDHGVDAGLGVRAAAPPPEIVTALVAEADGDDNELRQATILEVQRARTVIDFAGRHVAAPSFELGEWRIPQGYSIMVSIRQLHANAERSQTPSDSTRTATSATGRRHSRGCHSAAEPGVASARRSRTPRWTWCCERCCGISPSIRSTDPGEKVHSRGVAYTPKQRRPRRAAAAAEVRLVFGPPAAASSPAGRSGRCIRWGSAAGSPDVRARPPRSRRPG